MRPGPALGLCVLAGGLLAVQGRVNADLSTALAPGGAPVVAAAISFAVGTAAVLVIGLLTRSLRPARLAPTRWWFRLGGLGGAALVGSSAAAIPVVGVALTSVFVVTGQTAGGMAADGAGLGPSGRHAPTVPRVAGALVAVAALAVGAVGHTGRGLSPLLLAGVVVAGALVAGQQAVNGRLQQATGSAPYAALVSFAGGTLVLVAVAVVQGLAGALPPIHLHGPAWLYLGGFGGAVYITLNALCVRVLGVLRLSLASVLGQLVGGLVLDLAAPTRTTHVTAATYAAVLLTFVALIVSGLRGVRRGRSR